MEDKHEFATLLGQNSYLDIIKRVICVCVCRTDIMITIKVCVAWNSELCGPTKAFIRMRPVHTHTVTQSCNTNAIRWECEYNGPTVLNNRNISLAHFLSLSSYKARTGLISHIMGLVKTAVL